MEEAAIVSTLQLKRAAARTKPVVWLSHETEREEVEVVPDSVTPPTDRRGIWVSA